jgi:dienelactone hydrolase
VGRAQVEDLRAVVQHVRGLGRDVTALVGHSKAGSVVLLYGAQYNDVRCIVNVAGRFDMRKGIDQRLGAEGLAALAATGVWMQRDHLGPYAVTRESVEERRSTDMSVARNIQAAVLTVHGTADEVRGSSSPGRTHTPPIEVGVFRRMRLRRVTD